MDGTWCGAEVLGGGGARAAQAALAALAVVVHGRRRGACRRRCGENTAAAGRAGGVQASDGVSEGEWMRGGVIEWRRGIRR